MEVYKTLRNKRIELGLSQKTVGENVKVAQSTLCRFENGYKIQDNELIIHKLINFYKEKENIDVNQKKKQIIETRNKKPQNTTTKNNFDIMGEEIAKKFEKIFIIQLQKEAKKIYKKTLKQLIKEL